MAARAPEMRRDRDERSFDMRSLLRLGLWGVAAAICLGGVVLAAYTNVGSQRLMMAMTAAQPTPAQLAARTAETENETRRLAAAVQVLDSERQRLLTRITSLERGLEDITGSIQRQVVGAPTANSPPAETRSPSGSNGSSLEAAVSPERPTASSNVAALSSSDETRPVERAKLEFGIDLGAAANFDGLRALWNSIHSANPVLFEGLHPLVGVRENRRTRAAELRLLAGPFADAEAAARLCAMFSSTRRACQPAAFEGQQFSLIAEPESRPAATPTRRPATPVPKTVRQNPQQKSPAE